MIRTAQNLPLEQSIFDYNQSCLRGYDTPVNEMGPLRMATPLQIVQAIKTLDRRYAEFTPCRELKLLACRTAPAALKFVEEITQGPDHDLEPLIARGAKESLVYAQNFLKNRFLAGETAMAKKPEVAIEYAVTVLRERFYKAEAKLKETPYIRPGAPMRSMFDVYMEKLANAGIAGADNFRANMSIEKEDILRDYKEIMELISSTPGSRSAKDSLYNRLHQVREKALDMGIPAGMLDNIRDIDV